jgi:hypothetical protein
MGVALGDEGGRRIVILGVLLAANAEEDVLSRIPVEVTETDVLHESTAFDSALYPRQDGARRETPTFGDLMGCYKEGICRPEVKVGVLA